MLMEVSVISNEFPEPTVDEVDAYLRLGKVAANISRLKTFMPKEDLDEFNRLQDICTVLTNARNSGHKLTTNQLKLLRARTSVSSYRAMVVKINPWARTTNKQNEKIKN